jgi:hypothetical protein
MSSRPRKPSNTNPRAIASRSWRASLIRKKAQVLGEVQAPSREAAEAAAVEAAEAAAVEAAEAAAVKAFNLDDEQRSRLVVQERS